MSKWIPHGKQVDYLKMIKSITTDCLLFRAAMSRTEYTESVRRLADLIDWQDATIAEAESEQ